MPLDGPITDWHVARIDALARIAFGDAYTESGTGGERFLSERIAPIYGRGLYELNEGQAGMVIQDLQQATGDPQGHPIEWESIVTGNDRTSAE